ncbi:undecaprenyl-diphosphatase [Kitasatospora sp. SolWspMP-SS2h]|uniref:phosphatase PAP2 family protein n=1 Tax=Kitasatospora sp. SolWspMP-SS2h TaxID=1305729 RepID=UPI000DB9743E|nr:phosphatase PAP2 family protein [Kitasatospora sp. SolWspMP-SS2h]RAJ36778.1 undecaprenyl-diphosphatase [Kitasatospora sp. SolWspMP-SS2h]
MADRVSARRTAAPAAACAAAFGAVAVAAAANGWAPYGFEQAAVDWAVAHRPSAAVTAAKAVTALGTGAFPYLLALAAGLVLVRSVRPYRSGRAAAAVLLAPVLWLAAGQLLRQGLMHAFARPRPPVADWAFTASGFAFPSGHSFTSALSAGLIALAAARARPGARRPAAAAAALFAAVIGLTRVYLGVHWPLDVLGGWLLATAWLLLGSALPWRPGRHGESPNRVTTSM